ncbi:hypothetical protein EMCRGX_G011468 [Ephydatia muelleri]
MSDVKELQGWDSSAPPLYEPPQYPSPQTGFQPGYPTSQPGFQPPGYTPPAQPTPGYGQYGYAGFQPIPPPQYPQGQPFQPQLSSNVVVISAQPSAVTTTVVHCPTGDHYMTLSLVMTIICVMLGGWLSLMCTIPAITLAALVVGTQAGKLGTLVGIQSGEMGTGEAHIVVELMNPIPAKIDDAAGNAAAAKTKGYIALTLNIIAVVFHIVAIIAIVTPIAVAISSLSNENKYNYYNNYYSYSYYCQYCSHLSYSYCSYSYGYSSSYSSYTYSYYSCS